MFLILLLGAAMAHAAGPSSPAAVLAEAHCAALLGSALPPDPLEKNRVIEALGRVQSQLDRLEQTLNLPPRWFDPLRRAYREFRRDAGAVRLRLGTDHPRTRHAPRFARLVRSAHDRVHAARAELLQGRATAFPLYRVITGAPAIRTYLTELESEATLAQERIAAAAARADRTLGVTRAYPSKLIGTTFVAAVLGGMTYFAWWGTQWAVHTHHFHAAVALPALAALFLVPQLSPRLVRLGLSARDAFERTTGRGGASRRPPSARAVLGVGREILALIDRPDLSPDVLVVAGFMTPLSLRHIDAHRVFGGFGRRRPPTATEGIEAAATRAGGPRPVDARVMATDLLLSRNAEGQPELVVLGREVAHPADHR